MSEKQGVLVAHLHGDDVSSSFQFCLESMYMHDSNDRRLIQARANTQASSGGIPDARNQIAQTLLESDCEWLLTIDADMGFAPDILYRLMDVADPVNRPVIGALCFASFTNSPDGMGGFSTNIRPTTYKLVAGEDGIERYTAFDDYAVNSLVQVDATGGAFLLIHRSVFERIERPFDRIRWEDGTNVSEDISFFHRCRELGISAFVNTGARTTHMKHQWLNEQDYWDRKRVPCADEDILVIVPVLHRPENVRPLMTSLRASTGRADALYVVENNDREMTKLAHDHEALVVYESGTFARKVNSVFENDYADDYDWVILVGDDVRFHPGWWDHALYTARQHDAMVIATNDLVNPRVKAGEHATHPVMSVKYILERGASWDGPGVVCHEGYHHNFVDDEWTAVAKSRGVFAASLGSKVEHYHPIFGGAPDDEVYQLGRANFDKDAQLFKSRYNRYNGRKEKS